MPQITANGIAIEYEEFGPKDAPPMLLVMGLGAQLTRWSMDFVDAMVARGFRVIRYDNRDIGLSQKFDGSKPPALLWQGLLAKIGIKARVPYTLADMAADGAGLLDALGIDKAHIVGASMGGMIAQHIAFTFPEKTLSLTSIMSTTGNPKLPAADKAALEALITPLKDTAPETIRAQGVRIARAIGSPDYPAEIEVLHALSDANFARSHYPEGLPRQFAAIINDGCRRKRLAQVTAPSLVIHGEADPLVKMTGGEDTARHLKNAANGAVFKTYPGMGHDLPAPLIAPIADSIAQIAKT